MQKTNQLSPLFLESFAPGARLRHIGRQVFVAWKAVHLSTLRWYRRRQERQRMQTALAEMRHLDDHLLLDMGLDPHASRLAGGDMLDDPHRDRARFAQSYYDFVR